MTDDRAAGDLGHDEVVEVVRSRADGKLRYRHDGALVELSAGGGGLVPASVNADLYATAAVNMPADGGSANPAFLFPGVPEWLDATGHIIEPGIYAAYTEVSIGDAYTDPTARVRVTGALSDAAAEFDGRPSVGGSNKGNVMDIAGITDADLPYPLSVNIHSEADATGTWNLALVVVRLAH